MKPLREINNSLFSAMLIKTEVDKCYAVVTEDAFQLGMFFCRFQEYYESPIQGIRGQYFTWPKFISEYCKQTKDVIFGYPVEWEGYNIPSYSIRDSMWKFDDGCEYADEMIDVYMDCYNDCADEKFYLIGVPNTTGDTYRHEIAHALWYLNEEYNAEARRLIEAISPDEYEFSRKVLVTEGYAEDKEIIDDEIQANMLLGTSEYSDGFIKNFSKFVS